MSTVTQRKPRPTYPASLVAECRRMAAGGWSAYRIQELLQERGTNPCPSKSTVLYWVDDRRADVHRRRSNQQQARATASSSDFTFRARSPEYRTAFMRRLRAEGVPPESIAKVCTVVFGRATSGDTVRRILGVSR